MYTATGSVRRDSSLAASRVNGFRPSQDSRNAYFGPKYGRMKTPVIARNDLTRTPAKGPLLIDEYDSTTVVAPACTARLDTGGNIRIQIEV